MATTTAVVNNSMIDKPDASEVPGKQLHLKDGAASASVTLSMFEAGAIPSEWLTPDLKYDDGKSSLCVPTGEGDINSRCGNLAAFEGMWELLLKVSDSCEDVFTGLGLSTMQRALLRCYKSRVEIRVSNNTKTFESPDDRKAGPTSSHENLASHLSEAHAPDVVSSDTRSDQLMPVAHKLLSTDDHQLTKSENSDLWFHMKQFFPMNTVKELSIPQNGVTEYLESDTNTLWKISSLYHDGVFYQRRESPIGQLYDVRCLFKRHPEETSAALLQENIRPPIQLLRVTFIDPQGRKSVSNRWFQRTDDD